MFFLGGWVKSSSSSMTIILLRFPSRNIRYFKLLRFNQPFSSCLSSSYSTASNSTCGCWYQKANNHIIIIIIIIIIISFISLGALVNYLSTSLLFICFLFVSRLVSFITCVFVFVRFAVSITDHLSVVSAR